MAGIPSAWLVGWAIPMQLNNNWDHTYVVSSCGLRWGCRGRDKGGMPLRGAAGSSQLADCLAQPNAEAGIRYFRSGVCHQMANRILYPAGVTVAGCNGYRFSVLAFGEYGTDPVPWPELLACTQSKPVVKSVPAGGRVGKRSLSSKLDDGAAAVAADEEAIRMTELSELVEAGLGGPLDKPTFEKLATIQMRLRRTQADLAFALDHGSLSPEEYFDRVVTALQIAAKESYSLLGHNRFLAIFGEAGLHPEGMVERDLFLDRERR